MLSREEGEKSVCVTIGSLRAAEMQTGKGVRDKKTLSKCRGWWEKRRISEGRRDGRSWRRRREVGDRLYEKEGLRRWGQSKR